MTDKINAIIERSSTDIQRAPIIQAIVRRDGSRAIDTASITIPSGYRVSVNDTVSYIQDDAALTYLVALWNFQGSTRDEGGYHHDGDTASGGYIEPEGLHNRLAYRTNYGLKFTAAGQEVTVADNTSNGVSGGDNAGSFNPTTLDFRHQFDIIINFKVTDDGSSGSLTNTTQILFSKHDGTNGVEIGIKQVSSKWVVYAKLDSTTFTGDGTLYGISASVGKMEDDDTGATRCIRFYRDDTNRVRLTLDGIEDGTNCTQTVATNTNARPTTALKIGSNGTDDFKGMIFQIRVYCGGFLDENDFETLMSAGAQQMTQKISGNVWRREDSLKNIKIEIKSRSRSILDSEISFDTIHDNTTNTLKPATHTKNLFSGNQGLSDILQTIINYVDDDFVYLRSPAITSPVQLSYSSGGAGKYLAVGRFIKNVELLTTLANRSFLTFPTKTFVWEESTDGDSDKLNSGYVFSDSEYQIYNRGEDDSKVVNDLELYGDLQYKYKEQVFDTLSNFTANTPHATKFTFAPLNVTLVQGKANYASGGANGFTIPASKYEIDFNERTLTFLNTSWTNPNSVSSDYVWAKYVYEIQDDLTIAQGATDDATRHLKMPTTGHSHTLATASQGIYGIRSAKMYIPQLLNQSTFFLFATKFFNKSLTAKKRYTVKAPFLINCLRENLQITLSSTTMKFTNTDESSGLINGLRVGTAEDQSTLLTPVKSIVWKYPECETIIECGDHMYDLYDSSKETNDTAGTTQGSILKTGVSIS